MLTAILFFSHLMLLCGSSVVYLPNVDCGPYVDYVQTDPQKYFRFTPFFIKLFRCRGATAVLNPRNRICAPNPRGVKKVDIYLINNSNATHPYQIVQFENHTDCSEVCSLQKSACSPYQSFSKQDCVCSCHHDKTPNPNPCRSPFYWSMSMCNCICSVDTMVCPRRKEFSKDDCSCVCKQKFHVKCARRKMVVDEGSCDCIEPTVETGATKSPACIGIVSSGILMLVMLLEACVIITLYFLVYVYCYKRVYFKYKSDKERLSITNYESGNFYSDNTAQTIVQTRGEVDLEEEVPPFTRESLNRNSMNRNKNNVSNSLHNSLSRNGVSGNANNPCCVGDTNRTNMNGLNQNNTNSLNRYNTNSLNRNNTNSLNRYNTNSLNKNSLTKEPRVDFEEESNGEDEKSITDNFYSHEEKSHLNTPDDDAYLYTDIEPTKYYEGDMSENYKNISLV